MCIRPTDLPAFVPVRTSIFVAKRETQKREKKKRM